MTEGMLWIFAYIPLMVMVWCITQLLASKVADVTVKSIWDYDDPEAGYIYIYPPVSGWEEALLYQRCRCILVDRDIREQAKRDRKVIARLGR